MTGTTKDITNTAVTTVRRKIAELRNLQLQTALHGRIKESAEYAEKVQVLQQECCRVGAA